MPVPTLVTDLSTTLASNSPAGSDNVFPDLDNYLRALSGFVASIRDNSGNGWVSPYLPLAGGTVTGATIFSSTVALNGALSGTGLTTYLASPPAIGGTAPAAGSFTTLSASGNVTLSGGTANGVLYLNGSKVATSGSALTFDGTNLGLQVTPSAWSTTTSVFENPSGSIYSFSGTNQIGLNSNAYYNGTNWIYRNASSVGAADFYMQNGFFVWRTAVAGTSPNIIAYSEQMRLTSTGLGIGTSSPGYKLDVTVTPANNDAGINITNTDNSGYGASYNFSHRLTTAGAIARRTYISSEGAASGSFMRFATTDSGGTLAERARITSGGDLLVGTISSTANVRLRVDGGAIQGNAPTSISTGTHQLADNGSSPNTLRLYNTTDSNNTTNRFLICDAAASVLRAEIRSNGGLANYSGNNVNLSDRREKTNFAPAKSYLDTICAIPVQTFNYIDQSKDDPGLTLGVVAQDVQAVAPELVMESNWGTEDNPKMRLSIYQTDLQYALMKCIQEQQALITALTARVAALEAQP